MALYFSRCNAPGRIKEWSRWLREIHVPAMGTVDGVRAGSHWALTQQPAPGMPSVGFSHMTLYELVGDIGAVGRALEEHDAFRNRAKGMIETMSQDWFDYKP